MDDVFYILYIYFLNTQLIIQVWTTVCQFKFIMRISSFRNSHPSHYAPAADKHMFQMLELSFKVYQS